jgi:hypothetical protein
MLANMSAPAIRACSSRSTIEPIADYGTVTHLTSYFACDNTTIHRCEISDGQLFAGINDSQELLHQKTMMIMLSQAVIEQLTKGNRAAAHKIAHDNLKTITDSKQSLIALMKRIQTRTFTDVHPSEFRNMLERHSKVLRMYAEVEETRAIAVKAIADRADYRALLGMTDLDKSLPDITRSQPLFLKICFGKYEN